MKKLAVGLLVVCAILSGYVECYAKSYLDIISNKEVVTYDETVGLEEYYREGLRIELHKMTDGTYELKIFAGEDDIGEDVKVHDMTITCYADTHTDAMYAIDHLYD
jgi:hypothetical protein